MGLEHVDCGAVRERPPTPTPRLLAVPTPRLSPTRLWSETWEAQSLAGWLRARAALVTATPRSREAFPCASCFGSRWNAFGDLPSCGCCSVSPQLSDCSLSLAYISVISSGSVLWWPCLRSGGMGSVGEEACGPRADTAQAKPTRGRPPPSPMHSPPRAAGHCPSPGARLPPRHHS